MLLGISVGLFCVLISPWLGLHCGASTLTWLFVAPLFSFPNSGFSPQSIPLSAFAYSVNFNFKGKKKKQVTGYLLPERLLLPSKVAYGIVLSLPLVSWPRGSLGFHPPPLWDFPITALISTICHHFLFYGSFFQGLKNMLKFCYLKKCVVFFLTFYFCLGIAN